MPVTRPEIEGLYRQHSRHLLRLVRYGVIAPDATIEDACQSAWSRLLDHNERVGRDTALAWVARTAAREVRRLASTYRRETSLDAPRKKRRYKLILSSPGADERLEQRERLGALTGLPVRQQRLLWLQGVGFSYAEMASREGCSARAVERHLMRAKHTMRAAKL